MFSFGRLNNLTGWLVWLIATLVYLFTIEPSASFWDCGEYIACAYRLEIGHPPGAPFFMLMGRLFSLFGGDDPASAARMINVMSALSSSFSILFLFWSITRLAAKFYGTNHNQLSKAQHYAVLSAGVIGALAFTFSDTFWFNAVEGEVYAMSSLFTAIVFWAVLRWEEEDGRHPAAAMRWLILISFLIGISIGVHLLSLLTIPAICFVVYYKKYPATRKGFLITGLISLCLLVFVQNLLIPKIVKFVADYEVFFTNRLHLGFSSGTLIYFLLLTVALTFFIAYTASKKETYYKIAFITAITFAGFAVFSAPSGSGMALRFLLLGGMLYAIHRYKTQTVTLHAIFMSFATLLIGYSSFFVLVIRSQANPPMDENDPENAPNMLSYLLREQYGEAPLLFGHYYNSPRKPVSEFASGDPVYGKDKNKGMYHVIDSRKNSIPTYEKDYCTFFPRMYNNQLASYAAGYRYWGNVERNHRNKTTVNEYGESEITEVPTMKANLSFFVNYQVLYMYFRYLFWNFVGRQNDTQGSTGNNMDGNWVTGIKVIDDMKLDTDTSQLLHRDQRNLARNHFFGLPLLLGFLGMIFHFRRKAKDAWIVMCFFVMTGLAIIVYLNQTPYQVRERDYAYVGSFYAFAIWIGLGVLYVFEVLSKKTEARRAALAGVLLCLIVPGVMAHQGWDDHNRSQRTLSRATAINYLESCAENAVLFTNGDCDTFPLWYAQEVEGIRTDIRVVCLSLLQTDWYIRQMRRAAYKSQALPFSIPEEKLEGERLSFVFVDGRNANAVNLKDAVDTAIQDNPAMRLDYGENPPGLLPSKRFYVDVDSASIVRSGMVDKADEGRIVKRMEWDLGGRRYIVKNDLMILDLIANNNWKRPVYFTSPSAETCVGLKDYLQSEGIAYRLTPVKQNENERQQGGRVNTSVMYNNVMNKFLWGGMNQPGANLDENCLRMPANLRMQMSSLAQALLSEGKKDQARAVLKKCMSEMPDETVPFDATMFNICLAWYQLEDMREANNLARQLFTIFENDLRIYNAQKPNRKAAYQNDIEQARGILKSLTGLAQHYKQENLSQEFMNRLSAVIPVEELRD